MRDAAGAWISPEEDMERARSERRAAHMRITVTLFAVCDALTELEMEG